MKENNLPGKLLFKGIVGSQAYGLATPDSDVDIKGVYLSDIRDVITGNVQDTYEVHKDEMYFDFRHFMQLVRKNNPNILEMVFLPEDCVLYKDPMWDLLIRKNATQFLSKFAFGSYTGYAIKQVQKSNSLSSKLQWEKEVIERRNVLEFCHVALRNNGKVMKLSEIINDAINRTDVGITKINHTVNMYKLYVIPKMNTLRGIASEDSNDVHCSVIPKKYNNDWIGILYFNKKAYEEHCRKYSQYQRWLRTRNYQRYKTNKEHGQLYDGKNLMHTVRLLQTAELIPSLHTVEVQCRNRDHLLDIKNGRVDLKEIYDNIHKLISGIKKSFDESTLPESVSKELINEIVIKAYEQGN